MASVAPRSAGDSCSRFDVDVGSSADSLDLTPSPGQATKKQRQSAPSRRPTAQAAKRRPAPAGGGRSNSLPGQTRGMVRPVSLDAGQVAPLEDHEQFTPVDGSPDARLLNLERQANYDHFYLANIQQAIGQVLEFMKGEEERTKENAFIGVQLRKDLYG